MPISVSPTKNFLKKPKPPPLLRLNSDPKILPSTEESRIQEAFSVVLEDEFPSENENRIGKLRSRLIDSGSPNSANCDFLEPNSKLQRTNDNKINSNCTV